MKLAEAQSRPSRALATGVLYDFCEVFAGGPSPNLAGAFEQSGYTVFRIGLQLAHDLLDPRHRCGIIGFVLRHVVFAWQFAPARFDPEEPCSKEGHILVRFTGMMLHLTDEFGQVGILEQPRGSTLRPLAIARRLLGRGFVEARFDMWEHLFGKPLVG